MLNQTIGPALPNACDFEPIHIPGAIQPHGLMLVCDAALTCIGVAGRPEEFLTSPVLGKPLSEVLGLDLEGSAHKLRVGALSVLGRIEAPSGPLNAMAYRSGNYLVVELDRAERDTVQAVPFLVELDAASSAFEKTSKLEELCKAAAQVFREMTGFGRVMVYQFVDDDAGVVVGESIDKDSSSFMNHYFPASDIPRQARALYVRNRVRVIPDVSYEPQPIHSITTDLRELDLSDSTLRSVSPVHLQYLRNMGVAASASFSIIKDGVLWGLIACHHHEPREIPLAVRMGGQALSNALARQIRAKEEAAQYRERIRSRSQEDTVISLLGSDRSLEDFFSDGGAEIARLLAADGFAAVQGTELFTYGACPDPIDVREIASYARVPAATQPIATASLSRLFEAAIAYRDRASGLLAVTMSTEVPTILMWFRAEHVEVLKWAGNPHKDVPLEAGATLTPRASFEEWSESVRGRAKPWSHAEEDVASRIVKLMLEHRNNHRLRELNRELTTTLKENESLLVQKDFLMKEVNHRVQNSLQLVSAFLGMQGRATGNDEVRVSLNEAQKRLNAVALVHRRLYQDGSLEIVDLSRYLENLLSDMSTTMDRKWSESLDVDLSPILVSTDRAVNIGLVLTELVINAQKYAYNGDAGPLLIKLEQHRNSLRLIVADRGRGKLSKGSSGFGTRMLAAIIDRLQGNLDEEPNGPGLRVVVTAPVRAP